MQKVAFHLGTWPIHWYGVLVAAGFLVGLWTASRRGMRDGLAPERVMDAGPWVIIGTILGARSLYVTTYWSERFAGEPWTEVFMIQRGGLVFYGGLIGAALAVVLYSRVKKLPLWRLADAMAPSIALGSAFGRIGCLMNGCCYGGECRLPWAIRFPANHETGGTLVHPTQIYDSLLNLALYAGLAWLHRRKSFDGQVFAGYLICYAVARSVVEYFRGDYTAEHLHGGWFTPAQLISVGILVAGVLLCFCLRKQFRGSGEKMAMKNAKQQTPDAK